MGKKRFRVLSFFFMLALCAFLIGVGSQLRSGVRVEDAYGSSESLVMDPNIFVNLSKKIVPSVVNISSFTTMKSPLMKGDPNDVLNRLFGEMFRQYGNRGGGDDDDDDALPPPSVGPRGQPQKMPKAVSLGSGFIIDSSGLILTNNHVVADADEIKITFTEATDEKPSDAEVVGRDADLDVALIRVKNKREMTPVALGDSVEVGEYVIAVGNPVGHGHSVTHGIISAKGRLISDFPLATYLQTDAPINPGNSGGPLVNLKGEVIGINNAIDQRAQGIGFAIPMALVKKILPQLRTKGVVARGYIGVLVDNVTPEVAVKVGLPKDTSGPMVTQVYAGKPAALAGIKVYDVIVEFNNTPIKTGNDLITAVTGVPVGQKVPVKVSRAGTIKALTIEVAERPSAQQANKKEEHKKKKPKTQSNIQSGMNVEDITAETARELGLSEKELSGVLVSNVAYGGPADKAGLVRGDVILEVDRKPVKGAEAFFNTVKEKKSYLLRVRRSDPQGQEVFAVVILDLKS